MGDLQYYIYPEVIGHFLSGTHGYQLKKDEKTLDPTARVSLGHPSAIPCPHRFFLTYMRTMGKEHSALARWGPHWQDVRTATAANCASKREAMVMTRKMTEGPGASGRQVEITNKREREREKLQLLRSLICKWLVQSLPAHSVWLALVFLSGSLQWPSDLALLFLQLEAAGQFQRTHSFSFLICNVNHCLKFQKTDLALQKEVWCGPKLFRLYCFTNILQHCDSLKRRNY